jgi:hypothetical protein
MSITCKNGVRHDIIKNGVRHDIMEALGQVCIHAFVLARGYVI